MAKKSLRDRMIKKREDLKNKSNSGNMIFLKADTTLRVRILPMGEDQEFIKEVVQFYLGNDIKGVISPSTFGEPCAIEEAYNEFRSSDNDDDRELAKKFSPKSKYLAYCAVYKDQAGKELDEQNSPKFVLITEGLYKEILDLYLDDDDWGDMTDPEEGYDLKLKRVGSGKTDTEYFVTACPKTPAPKAFRNKVYNLDEEIRKVVPSYEKTKELLAQYLGIDKDEEDEDPKPKTRTGTKKVIKKRKTDLDE